ncbi:MAG: SRPBCC family protein [Parachlamydia sp.]|jgi:hypothetical protein|nr:SRPBCC family protein [Parachlamydia sp.]
MLIIKHTVETKVSSETIWSIWQDVKQWNTWDHGIEYSTLKGPFEKGARGTIKPKGGPLVHTELTCVEPLKKFVVESRLFLARIIVLHDLARLGDKTLVTHQIEMTGPLAFFFACLISRTMKKNLPREMESMVKKAEMYEKK